MTLTNEIIKAEFKKVKEQLKSRKDKLDIPGLEKIKSGYVKYQVSKALYIDQIKDKKKFEEERLAELMKRIDEDLIDSTKELEMFNKILEDCDNAIKEVKSLTTKPEDVKKKTTSKK